MLLSANAKLPFVTGLIINPLMDVAVATPSTGVVNVLLVKVSVPAKVANVPAVGKVRVVVLVEFKVVVNAPEVTSLLLLANAKLPPVVEAIVNPLMDVALATPSVGVINVAEFNVLLVKDWEPFNVTILPLKALSGIEEIGKEIAPLVIVNPFLPVIKPFVTKLPLKEASPFITVFSVERPKTIVFDKSTVAP